jgi:hypothetical protein
LTRPGTATFRLWGLPETEFAAGLDIRGAAGKPIPTEQQRGEATISLEISERSGRVLFAKAGPLDAWTWTIPQHRRWAFVYGRGEPGTYFTPDPEREYALTIRVLEPLPSEPRYTATLVAKSGGWK